MHILSSVAKAKKGLIISFYQLTYIDTYRDPTQETQRSISLFITGPRVAVNQLPSGLTPWGCLNHSSVCHTGSHTPTGVIKASLSWWCRAELGRESMRAKVPISAKGNASTCPVWQGLGCCSWWFAEDVDVCYLIAQHLSCWVHRWSWWPSDLPAIGRAAAAWADGSDTAPLTPSVSKKWQGQHPGGIQRQNREKKTPADMSDVSDIYHMQILCLCLGSAEH